MSIIKIIELVGVSTEGSDGAVREALREAARTIRGIDSIEVVKTECLVRDNQIAEWHATVRLAFPVERS